MMTQTVSLRGSLERLALGKTHCQPRALDALRYLTARECGSQTVPNPSSRSRWCSARTLASR